MRARDVVRMGSLAMVVLALGCTEGGRGAGGGKPAAVAPAPSAGGAASAMGGAARLASVQGTVKETMDAASYTYALLTTADGKDVWVAGPKTALEKGQTVEAVDAAEMRDFESTTLGRKFDRILFAAALVPPGAVKGAAGAMPPGHPPMGAAGGAGAMGGGAMPPGHPPINAAGGVAAAGGMGGAAKERMTVAKTEVPAGLAKAEGPAGRTVAEVHEQAAALKGQPVDVRGVVVKFSPGIMGRNWVHLQDGSGDATKGSHDLTATTQATVATGDKVLVHGTVAADKDFGAGYVYPVILEDATFAVEK